MVYQKSSERQFAQQEARNWRQQVYRDPDGEVAVCLAAYVDNTVQGCLDLLKVPGQPAGSSQVCVRADSSADVCRQTCICRACGR